MNHLVSCLLICATIVNAGLSGRISYERSAVVLPLWEQKGPKTPQIIGCALNKNGTPIRRESIVVTIDGIDMAIVLSDSRGIWSYYVRPSDELMEGFHIITARSARSGVALQTTRFIAAYDQKQLQKVGAGNASLAYSRLLTPQGNCINYRNPTIVGIVRNSEGAPVWGEVVTVSVDGIALAQVSSDERGVFAYTPAKGHEFAAGEHKLSAFCGNSAFELDPIVFRIDMHDPKVPVISLPDPGSCVKSPVTVAGTAEPYSEVVIFIDNAEEGELAFADEKGEWGIFITFDSGDHSVEACARDCAGNQGKLSSDIEFFVE